MKLLLGLLLALAYCAAYPDHETLRHLNSVRRQVNAQLGRRVDDLQFDSGLYHAALKLPCNQLGHQQRGYRYFFITNNPTLRAMHDTIIPGFMHGDLQYNDVVERKSYAMLEAVAPGQTHAACIRKQCESEIFAALDLQTLCLVGPYESLREALFEAPNRGRQYPRTEPEGPGDLTDYPGGGYYPRPPVDKYPVDRGDELGGRDHVGFIAVDEFY